ncbi:MAG: hypothetical protein M0R03_20880 [Novosphingobium sp.]|nr:hypothetical protein [Novosphingobium sp.]
MDNKNDRKKYSKESVSAMTIDDIVSCWNACLDDDPDASDIDVLEVILQYFKNIESELLESNKNLRYENDKLKSNINLLLRMKR